MSYIQTIDQDKALEFVQHETKPSGSSQDKDKDKDKDAADGRQSKRARTSGRRSTGAAAAGGGAEDEGEESE